MSLKITTLALVVLAIPAAYPSWAQSPAQTGAGGGPGSTVTAPNTTSVGQTKPPGRAAGAEVERSPKKKTRSRNDSELSKGICVGCN